MGNLLDGASFDPDCTILIFVGPELGFVALTSFARLLLVDSRNELRLTQIGWVPVGSLILICGGRIGSLSNGSRETTAARVLVYSLSSS